MKKPKLLAIFTLLVLLVFLFCFLPVWAAEMTPVKGVSPVAPKYSFTLEDLNKARKMTSTKPQILLSWQTRVRLANDALARDGAMVKKEVDEVLARADKKYIDCSAKDYTLQDLQTLCQPHEGVQACLDRLRMNCVMGQSSQKQADSMANALAAMNIQAVLERMKKDITALEHALYK
ncbi:MAG: hypothetical protein JW902_00340 [Syntrophaceae bacterium]|nr:hypothetical protein [Syntrophaceae bacterium]